MIVCESRALFEALGIVAKEQGSARCAIRQNSSDFQIAFF